MRKRKKEGHIFNFYEGMLKSRKGLSNIVATLIIILLVIVSIGVVWVVINNLITGGAGQIELSQKCLTVDFSSVSVLPVSGQAGNYSITLSRGSSGETVEGVKITIFNSTDNSGNLEFGESLGRLDVKTKILDSGIINANKIWITPYFRDSFGNEEICPQVRSFTFGSSGAAVSEGGNGGNGDGEGEPGAGFCGDGIIQNPNGEDPAINEECDGSNLNSQTCIGLGYVSGTLSCDSQCQYNTSECVQSTPSSCDGTWESQYFAEGIYECDGTPLPNGCSSSCVCETGFSHKGEEGDGTCDLNAPVLTGFIFSVWPEDQSAKRFQSVQLPKSQEGLQGYGSYYVNFSNSPETSCFGISGAFYYGDVNRSEIDLNIPSPFTNLANISGGDSQGFSLWEAFMCGQ